MRKYAERASLSPGRGKSAFLVMVEALACKMAKHCFEARRKESSSAFSRYARIEV